MVTTEQTEKHRNAARLVGVGLFAIGFLLLVYALATHTYPTALGFFSTLFVVAGVVINILGRISIWWNLE